jgi:high-affinity iron transporter
MAGIALESFFIVLREGLEALLVIAALSAFLLRAGEGHRRRALAWGAGLALIASIVMAWIFMIFFDGAHDDLTEAIVMGIAAALMLYVSGWLWLRQNPAVWNRYLQRQADRALAADAPWMLAGIAFLAVFREGAETILFLHAVIGDGAHGFQAMLAGLLAAIFALGIIYAVMTRLALQLPLRPVFMATSAILFLLGLRFIGQAMLELQEIGAVSYTDIGLPAWAVQAGFNPTIEAIAMQLVLLFGAGLGAVLHARNRPRGGGHSQDNARTPRTEAA